MKFFVLLICFLILFSSCATERVIEEPFEVSLKSPRIPAGTIDAQFDRVFGGLRRENIEVSYFPREDAVCLEFRIDSMTYYQFWSSKGRETFILALEAYKEDYLQKAFNRSSRKTKRHYDTVKGFLIWQAFRFTIQASAEVNIDLGYFFKENRPYFSVNQREAYYLDPIARSDNRRSNEITMYFIRSQADELAAIFNPEYLRGLTAVNIEGGNQGLFSTLDIIYDDY